MHVTVLTAQKLGINSASLEQKSWETALKCPSSHLLPRIPKDRWAISCGEGEYLAWDCQSFAGAAAKSSLAYPTHLPYLPLARNLSLSGFATDLERPVPGDRAFLGRESGLGLAPDEPNSCLSQALLPLAPLPSACCRTGAAGAGMRHSRVHIGVNSLNSSALNSTRLNWDSHMDLAHALVTLPLPSAQLINHQEQKNARKKGIQDPKSRVNPTPEHTESLRKENGCFGGQENLSLVSPYLPCPI